MTLREFKVWGGKREENDSFYIWAKDADDAIGIARLTDQSICTSQWTGNEKSCEEALEQEPILDKIRAEIARYEADCILQGGADECEKCNSNVFGSIYRIIDKYKAESEE